MKRKRAWIGSLILGLFAAWSITPALAGNSRTVSLGKDVTLDGQPIAPGDYKLVWTPNGNPDGLTLTVKRANKVVATATAKRVKESAPASDDSIVYSRAQDGTREIIEIRFGGAKEVIRIDSSAQARK